MNGEKNYITVADLNKYIKHIVDTNMNLQNVYLKGEISNFKAHTRGHWYFTLKDETSRINAIMFASSTSNVKFTPIDGMKVLINGKLSVYEASGSYQIYVNEMNEDGIGNLYIAFEQLKKKLEAEGLFDNRYKKRIPKIPKRIGIVTASTGAAIKDILSTIKRRFPICETILFPSLVQGDEAASCIVKQINEAQNYNLDILIIGRGGGSIEDLWAFNEEIVARAIFDSKVPIISAVGHEVDYTISDFVADLRAPTPTGAAEMAVPNLTDILNYISQVKIRLNESLKKRIDYSKLLLNKYQNSYILKNPISIYEMKEQKLDILIDKLINRTNNVVNNNKLLLSRFDLKRINKSTLNILDRNNLKINSIIEKLEVLNPLNGLKRGYAIIKKDDKAITDIKLIKKDDTININIKNGNIKSKVLEVNMED